LGLIGLFVLAILIGVIESCMARLKLLHVPQLLVTSCILSLLALIAAVRL